MTNVEITCDPIPLRYLFEIKYHFPLPPAKKCASLPSEKSDRFDHSPSVRIEALGRRLPLSEDQAGGVPGFAWR